MTDLAVAELPTVDYGHATPVVIHFDDLDAMGIVHNSRYAVLLERAVSSWWSERGVTFSGGRSTSPDTFNVVREFTITYHAPIRGTGQVALHFWIRHLGTSSAVYGFRFLSADGATIYSEGHRVNVRVDARSLRPTAWTDAGRTLAAELLPPASGH